MTPTQHKQSERRSLLAGALSSLVNLWKRTTISQKRREYGKWRRFFCPEFLYWLTNGYGTRWLRAAFVFLTIVLLFTLVYVWTEQDISGPTFDDALLFSLKVATLQRPDSPGGLTKLGQWAQFTEAVLGPVQIALLALAVRMRLRR
jgi:hypothetical protein